jgi:hypothetical protein
MGAFFTEADIAALDGRWSWLAGVAGQAMQQGNEGFGEDTLAGARPWGFRPPDDLTPRMRGEFIGLYRWWRADKARDPQ